MIGIDKKEAGIYQSIMTDSQQTINRREPKGSLGQLKMQSYKMPVQLIDKINRLAEAKRVTKAQVVRGAVEGLDEGE